MLLLTVFFLALRPRHFHYSPNPSPKLHCRFHEVASLLVSHYFTYMLLISNRLSSQQGNKHTFRIFCISDGSRQPYARNKWENQCALPDYSFNCTWRVLSSALALPWCVYVATLNIMLRNLCNTSFKWNELHHKVTLYSYLGYFLRLRYVIFENCLYWSKTDKWKLRSVC